MLSRLLSCRTLTEAEVERLLAAVPPGTDPLRVRDRALLEVLAATGLRAFEVAELRVACLGSLALFLPLRATGRSRAVLITRRAWAALLAAIPPGAELGAAIFKDEAGRTLTGAEVEGIVASYLQAAGLAGSVDTLRASLAARLLGRGMPREAVAALLGEADPAGGPVFGMMQVASLIVRYRDAMGEI